MLTRVYQSTITTCTKRCCVLFLLRKTDHLTDGLKDLHWLPITFRIHYKLCLLYWATVHHISRPIRSLSSSDRPTRMHLPMSFHELLPSWVNVRLQVLDPLLGTNCPNRVVQKMTQSPSNATEKLIFLSTLLITRRFIFISRGNILCVNRG